jgi:hypothetical protein
MQSEDRIIHFGVELIHTPIRYKKESLQKLYYELSQTRNAAYDSTDFTNPAQARFYSKTGQRTQSICLFLPDRVLILEEWAEIPLSHFIEKVEAIGARILEMEGVKQFIAHTATIRSTFALTHVQDGRVYILEHMCGQQGRIGQHFQRPISLAGLRLHFPEADEYPGNFQVAIEPFRQSRNEIYVEAKGVFTREPVGPGSITVVTDHCRGVRSFISDRVFPYMNQFDVPKAPLE